MQSDTDTRMLNMIQRLNGMDIAFGTASSSSLSATSSSSSSSLSSTSSSSSSFKSLPITSINTIENENDYENENENEDQNYTKYGDVFIKKQEDQTVGSLIRKVGELQEEINQVISEYSSTEYLAKTPIFNIPISSLKETMEINKLNHLCNILENKKKKRNNSGQDEFHFDDLNEEESSDDDNDDELDGEEDEGEEGSSPMQDIDDEFSKLSELAFEYEHLYIILELLGEKLNCDNFSKHLGFRFKYDDLFE